MVWATPSIFKPSVYPSDVIICPINALKAFSSLDNELLSKQPCRAISACRLIWSHKELMPCVGGEGRGEQESVGDMARSLHRTMKSSVSRTQKIPNALPHFCSVCRFLSLPWSRVSNFTSQTQDHHNQGMWCRPYYWKQFPREGDFAWKALPDHLCKLWLQQWSLSYISSFKAREMFNLFTVWPDASYLRSLSFSFFICKMRMIECIDAQGKEIGLGL